jgi:plastocyanin
MWIHAGDSITWTVPTGEPHTVTFLVANQVRPDFQTGCPGFSPSGVSFDGSSCVSTPPLAQGQSFTISFPTVGNYKLSCLFHPDMAGVIHVLNPGERLPYTQKFYDREAAKQANLLISVRGDDEHEGKGHAADLDDMFPANSNAAREVVTGMGIIGATPGGSDSTSVMRFMDPVIRIHAGQTVEWSNFDPSTPHTVTFGQEPQNPVPPSSNVTVDEDGALHAIINSPSDNVHSGFIAPAPQERTGLPQAPISATRFRITFTHAGVYPYICVLHDNLGMVGKVIVQP